MASLTDSKCTCPEFWRGYGPRPPCPAHTVFVQGAPDGSGARHFRGCLVARHPGYGTWETSGFPWCTCRRELL